MYLPLLWEAALPLQKKLGQTTVTQVWSCLSLFKYAVYASTVLPATVAENTVSSSNPAGINSQFIGLALYLRGLGPEMNVSMKAYKIKSVLYVF